MVVKTLYEIWSKKLLEDMSLIEIIVVNRKKE
jgi:hypothetical protein